MSRPSWISRRSWYSPRFQWHYWRAKRREACLIQQPCSEGNCVELINPRTGENTGGWGPVGCPCQDAATLDAGQWAVRAKNGLTCHASEDVARAAITEGGYTLGPDRSPIIEALFRTDADAEWTRVPPPVEQR